MSVTETAKASADMAAPPAQMQVEAKVKQAKAKPATTGDVLQDVATEIELLTKAKAIHLADRLVEDIDSNSFKLGGVLKVIKDNQWIEGYDSFEAFVSNRYGFQDRKARYLIDIYEHLVTKNIPWDKVKDLGWTKLKDLARYLTLENVDAWVAKVTPMSWSEMYAVLKDTKEGEGTPPTGEKKTTSDTTTLKFKLKNDQLETVQSALSKYKAEGKTEYDNVALEMICAGYLGGTVAAAKGGDLEAQMKSLGWKAVLGVFEKVFPKVDLTVSANEG